VILRNGIRHRLYYQSSITYIDEFKKCCIQYSGCCRSHSTVCVRSISSKRTSLPRFRRLPSWLRSWLPSWLRSWLPPLRLRLPWLGLGRRLGRLRRLLLKHTEEITIGRKYLHLFFVTSGLAIWF
jgi:hypothetical protein